MAATSIAGSSLAAEWIVRPASAKRLLASGGPSAEFVERSGAEIVHDAPHLGGVERTRSRQPLDPGSWVLGEPVELEGDGGS